MKAFDCVNKQEVEVTKEGLIDFMKKDRQIEDKVSLFAIDIQFGRVTVPRMRLSL